MFSKFKRLMIQSSDTSTATDYRLVKSIYLYVILLFTFIITAILVVVYLPTPTKIQPRLRFLQKYTALTSKGNVIRY